MSRPYRHRSRLKALIKPLRFTIDVSPEWIIATCSDGKRWQGHPPDGLLNCFLAIWQASGVAKTLEISIKEQNVQL